VGGAGPCGEGGEGEAGTALLQPTDSVGEGAGGEWSGEETYLHGHERTREQ